MWTHRYDYSRAISMDNVWFFKDGVCAFIVYASASWEDDSDPIEDLITLLGSKQIEA